MRGVLSSGAQARLGMIGFTGLAKRCGVSSIDAKTIVDAASARQAGREAALDATQGIKPDLLIMCAAVGFEEHFLTGINEVCSGVPVVGATSGNDALIDGQQDAPWQLFGSIAGWGAHSHPLGAPGGGVVLLAIWSTETSEMHNILSHCYGKTQKSGTVTNADGRSILEIDGRKAFEVFSEWTGLTMPLSNKQLAQYALAFDDPGSPSGSPSRASVDPSMSFPSRLVDVKSVGPDGELLCYASTAAELGRCAVSAVHVKPHDVIGAIREIARKAKDEVDFEVQGALVVVCGGTSTMFSQADLDSFRKNLLDIAPEVIAVFSFGEQGKTSSHGDSVHGNNMLNFLFFGSPKCEFIEDDPFGLEAA
jgi:hypothetical protein